MKKALFMAGSAVLIAGTIIVATLRHAPSLDETIETPTVTSTATYTPTPTPTYTPTSTPTPEISPEFLALRYTLADRIAEYKTEQGIETAIVVTDLHTNETIDVNGDVMMRPGCTANLFALLAIMEDVEKGNISLDAVRDKLAEGVAYSHPNRFTEIFASQDGYGSSEAGEQRVRTYMSNHGFPGIYLHVPATEGAVGENSMSARVVNDAFVRLYRGELFNPQITEETENLLRDGIPGYLLYMLPEKIQGKYEWIMRKLGTFEDDNGFRPEIDCGIIRPLSERTYSICVFTAGGTSIRDTRRGTGSYVIADLSEMVLNYFEQ